MPDLKKQNEQIRRAHKQAGPAIGFGSTFAGGMAVFGLGGHWLDNKTGKEPLFTLLGIGLGLLFGVWELWKLIAITNQQTAEKKQIPAESEEIKPDEPPE